tara:strand:- start:656 stop:931 length:276 start_codon:yes stop_codon:yes gene_type:complete
MTGQFDYKGKDGIVRDYLKCKSEFKYIYLPAMRGPWQELKDARLKDKIHKITNLHVESARAAPYFWGHMTMIFSTLNLVVMGVLVTCLLRT